MHYLQSHLVRISDKRLSQQELLNVYAREPRQSSLVECFDKIR